MSIIQGVASGSEIDVGDPITYSLRFNSADNAYLNRTFGTPTNNKIFSFSFWVKRAAISLYNGIFGTSDEDKLIFLNDNTLYWQTVSPFGQLITTQVFRDASAAYHILIVMDSTQVTAADRQKIYVNGTQVTSFSTATYITQNSSPYFNSAVAHAIGAVSNAGFPFQPGDFYLSQMVFVDGQALTPSSFGRTSANTGVWVPKTYTGTYGNNGFLLTFSDNSGTTSTTLGKDTSGNANNWTPNNFSVTAGAGNDSLSDTPTNNYCTLNPLDSYPSMLSNGNLDYSGSGGNNENVTGSMTFDIATDKVWFEVTMTTLQGYAGILAATADGIKTGTVAGAFYTCYVGSAGAAHQKSSSYGSSVAYSATTATAGEVLNVRCGGGEIEFYKDGVSMGVAYSGLTGRFKPFGMRPAGGTQSYNFGQRAFAYTPPTGYKALCTANMPVPTILQGSSNFNINTRSGTGSAFSVSGFSFKPDLVWTKERSNSRNHALSIILSGTGIYDVSNDYTVSPVTDAQAVTAFNSDGFSGGTAAVINTNTSTYVDWMWKGAGATSSNTAGSITSTVSVNSTAGISFVRYTGNNTNGATVGHGLGIAPSMAIHFTETANYSNHYVWHTSLTSYTYSLYLNTTGTETNSGNYSAAPSSTVFTFPANNQTNASAKNYNMICFAAITGFSAFGKYTGNGSSDGPFVYCGFRPKFILLKSASSINYWSIVDAARSPYNVCSLELNPNVPDSEYSGGSSTNVDFLSNGFKLRGTVSNGSSNTYIYAAFAENPFNYSRAR